MRTLKFILTAMLCMGGMQGATIFNFSFTIPSSFPGGQAVYKATGTMTATDNGDGSFTVIDMGGM